LDKKDFKLVNHDKLKENGYKDSGTLKISDSYTTNQFGIVSYLKGGMKLNLIIGIDFSIHNENYNSKYCYHHEGLNDYIECILIIILIIFFIFLIFLVASKYMSIFSSYGKEEVCAFGINSEHSDLFELSNKREKSIEGLEDFIKHYQKASKENKFSEKITAKQVKIKKLIN
jgi:hypothetical protein